MIKESNFATYNKLKNFPNSRISDKPSQIYLLKTWGPSFCIHGGSIIHEKFLRSDKKGIMIYIPGL